MKYIYNEGRVVGLSAYELYVRQLLSQDPDATPISEREWLATSLASNLSMILKIPAGTEAGIHEFFLPSNSQLIACSTIYATLFEGDVEVDENGWATKVTDYGDLILNTVDSHPVTPGMPANVPVQDSSLEISDALKAKSENYSKVASGLIIHPGKWEQDEETDPFYLEPDLTKPDFLRLKILSDTTADICIYLHGFVNSAVYQAEISPAYPSDISHAENGDFLGPAKFPWASPVIFIASQVSQIVTNANFTELFSRMDSAEAALSRTLEIEETNYEIDIYRAVEIEDNNPGGSGTGELRRILQVEDNNVDGHADLVSRSLIIEDLGE